VLPCCFSCACAVGLLPPGHFLPHRPNPVTDSLDYEFVLFSWFTQLLTFLYIPKKRISDWLEHSLLGFCSSFLHMIFFLNNVGESYAISLRMRCSQYKLYGKWGRRQEVSSYKNPTGQHTSCLKPLKFEQGLHNLPRP